jgi:hypothetical protein
MLEELFSGWTRLPFLSLQRQSNEFELNPAERQENEVTRILGFSPELLDYPFFIPLK